MADYKEILGALINKAKGAVEGSGIADVYQKGAGRTKAYAKIARLTLDLNSQADELRKVYTEIGKLYFEQAKDKPEGFFAPLFAQAGSLTADMQAKETELAALKEALKEAAAEKDIEVEITEDVQSFDEVVNATEAEGKGDGE
jgi:hypothetical protein